MKRRYPPFVNAIRKLIGRADLLLVVCFSPRLQTPTPVVKNVVSCDGKNKANMEIWK